MRSIQSIPGYLLFVILTAGFSATASADQFEDSGFYFGGSYGLVTVDG